MEFLIYTGLSIIAVIAFRYIGAWMLRINEMVKVLKDIHKELKQFNERD